LYRQQYEGKSRQAEHDATIKRIPPSAIIIFFNFGSDNKNWRLGWEI
jgi:hypothetical protein